MHVCVKKRRFHRLVFVTGANNCGPTDEGIYANVSTADIRPTALQPYRELH